MSREDGEAHRGRGGLTRTCWTGLDSRLRPFTSGHDCLWEIMASSVGSSCLMCFTMKVSLLLLLVFSVSDRPAGAKKQAAASPDDHGTRLRGLWKLHMRDSLLKGKAGSHHPITEGVKQQLLYCRVGIGFHLQILSNGSVGGVHKPTDNCLCDVPEGHIRAFMGGFTSISPSPQGWLKVFAMKQGVVGIRGVQSGLYLCMSGEGLAYGAEQFSDDCLLKENLEENHYTTYSSLSHPGIFLALSHRGELRKGSSVGRHQSCTHFLPRRSR